MIVYEKEANILWIIECPFGTLSRGLRSLVNHAHISHWKLTSASSLKAAISGGNNRKINVSVTIHINDLILML